MSKIYKGSSPNVRRIVFVNDDENELAALVNMAGEEFPKLEVYGQESIFACYQGLRCFDYIVIDISAVAPLMASDIQHAYGPISFYLKEYPATKVVIMSACGRETAQEVIDQVVKEIGDSSRVIYGGKNLEAVKNKLHELIKPEDMEWTVVKSRLTKK